MGWSGFEPGESVGRLRIRREIGRGAFGRVYEAEDTLVGRTVALKVVAADLARDAERDRSVREARAIGRLNSPHIVTLYHVEPPGERDVWLFEMEYVEGGTLADLLDRGRMPVARLLQVARDVAAGLDAAHRVGVVHGDVKPRNVLLGADGRARLADFGLSRLLGDRSLSQSVEEHLRGTPIYMAPEIVTGGAPTTATDVWSFGVALFQMVAGRVPFRGANVFALFYAIQESEPPPLPATCPAGLGEKILRCLAKDPAQRPRTCGAVVAEPDAPAMATAEPTPSALAGPIGRASEMRRIDEVLANAAEGRGAVVLITGETGIGKSTVGAAARAFAVARGLEWIEAGLTRMQGLLRPLLQAVRQTVDRREPNDVSGMFRSAADIVRNLLEEGTTVRLENREQSAWALEQLLVGLAQEHRLVLLLEDAHHADGDEVQVIRHLAEHVGEAGIVLIVSARPGDAANELASRPETIAMRLERLTREDTYLLLEKEAPIDAGTADAIFRLTQGNPLFALELARHGRSEGVSPDADTASLPRRVQDAVALRLRNLSEEDRALMDIAAVDGLEFDGEAVSAVSGEPILVVLRRLQRVHRDHHIIEPSPRGFRFTSAIFQEVLHGDLSAELRRQIHLALAEHLEQRAGIDPERLGTHWERAGRKETAGPYLVRAARRAASRQEMRRAIDLCERAGLDPAEIDPVQAIEHAALLFQIGGLYADSGQMEKSHALFRLLISGAEQTRDETLRLRAVVRHSEFLYFERGMEAIDEGLLRTAAETLPNCPELGLARYLLGVIEKYRDHLDESERWLRRADEVFRRLRIRSRQSSVVDQMASLALRSGRFREAETRYAEAARISAEVGRRANAATSQVNRAMAAMSRGALDGLEQDLARSIRVLELEGARNLAAHATVMLADVLHGQGHTARAIETAVTACDRLASTSYLPGLISAQAVLAYLSAARGELENACRALDIAGDAARRSDDVGGLCWIDGVAAMIATCGGDPGEGERRASAALDRVESGANPVADLDLVVCLLEAGLAGLPRTLFDRALRIARAQADTADGEEAIARALLAGMSAIGDPEGAPALLHDAADAIAAESTGRRRAVVEIARQRFLAEAHRRSGELAAALRAATEAHEAAAALEHVWLEADLFRLLHVLDPDSCYDRRLSDLLEQVAAPGPVDVLARVWRADY